MNTTVIDKEAHFQDGLSVACPAGAEGWEEMYPRYLLFSTENEAWEKEQFWFHDSMHHPHPLLPFETIIPECIRLGLGQNNSRIFMVPNAYGIEQRIVNGYVYFSPVQEKDINKIKVRESFFKERTQFYYQNWDKAYDHWKSKVSHLIEQLKAIQVADLPEKEPDEVVHQFLGYSHGYSLLKDYHSLIDSLFLAWQYHFEMLNVGYIAYLNFINVCRNYFPSISDKTISHMVKGFHSLLFTPDQKLRELASLAISLSVSEVIMSHGYSKGKIQLEKSEAGRQWLNHFDQAKEPWFNFSNGNGFYSHHGSWIDDLEVPFNSIKNYIHFIQQGQEIYRNLEEELKERETLVEKYKSLLLSQIQKEEFTKALELARTVAVYLEDHNFYIENWLHTIFWQKMKKIALIACRFNFIHAPEDLYYLNRWEVGELLYELTATWASGAIARGSFSWPTIILKRKKICEVLKRTPPTPAIGKTPDSINEPLTVTLFGITQTMLNKWRGKAEENNYRQSLMGLGAVSGLAKGEARLILSAQDLMDFKQGDILVCESLAPSWLSMLKKAGGVIAQIGGIMSHTAIICREYKIPCIVAVPYAVQLIQSGAKLWMDGEQGVIQFEPNDV